MSYLNNTPIWFLLNPVWCRHSCAFRRFHSINSLGILYFVGPLGRSLLWSRTLQLRADPEESLRHRLGSIMKFLLSTNFMFLSSKILMESIFNTNPTSNDKQLTISQEKIVIKHLLAWASLSPSLAFFQFSKGIIRKIFLGSVNLWIFYVTTWGSNSLTVTDLPLLVCYRYYCFVILWNVFAVPDWRK